MSYTPPLGSAVDFQYDTGGYTPPVGGLLFDYSQDGVYRATGYGHLSPLGGGALGSTPESDTYIPPLGYRVHFQYDSEPYEAPLYNRIYFGPDDPLADGLGALVLGGAGVAGHGVSASGSGTLLLDGIADCNIPPFGIGAGSVTLAGSASLKHGTRITASSAFTLSGSAAVTHRPPVICTGSGAIAAFSGSAAVTFIPPIIADGAGAVPFSGSGVAYLGAGIRGVGAVRLGGSASVMAGRYATGSGAIRLAARGFMHRGNAATGSGAVVLSGSARCDTAPVFSSSATGGLRLGGYGSVFHPVAQTIPSDTVFVRTTCNEVTYVG